ncbi:ABC transporter permease [Arthrobacter agilis]|uniref:ABC transporter permease n=1 Tax=Arthrobacter agilis TaxID=37921 RepID=A0A2L0UAM8_9MICC|nr:sugar ABC transporter permease [Arthrobacter agilis]AUZ86315.1 ABC transporter permease [Arthrobacter agilis]
MTTTLNRPAASSPAPAKPTLTFRQRLNVFDMKASPYLYISPFFLLFALVGLFPLGYTFFVSLFDWHLLKGQGEFVGLRNFQEVLQDRFFWNSLFNTMSIFLLSTIPQLIVATAIAAVLDQNLRARTFWRMSILLPYIVTPVAVALIFSNLFGEQYGLINNILESFGFDRILWTNETLPSHIAIATMVNWRWTGYNALILLAAMQSVPRDIYESAAIDGAGVFRRFFSITLPSIRPTMIFVVITATIGGLQIFTEPRLFDPRTYGGTAAQFQTTVLYLYEMAFQRQNFGKASTIAWLLFLIIVLFGLVNYLISQRIATTGDGRGPGRGADSRRRSPAPAVVLPAAGPQPPAPAAGPAPDPAADPAGTPADTTPRSGQ